MKRDRSGYNRAGDLEKEDSAEDFGPQDDAIIGKAFRWSLAVIGLVLVIGGALFFLMQSEPQASETEVTDLTAPETQELPDVQVPTTPFTEITEKAGIDFVHNNGAVGDKLLPETMGGGVAFFDYNNDGFADLLFVNSNYWPQDLATGKEPTTMRLYENDGDGTFTDVTQEADLDVSAYGMGVAVGDYNNDGWSDLFFTAVGRDRLFKNLGNGQFREVTESAGVGGGSEEWSTAATWIDYNNDSRLDLFVCHYVEWSRKIDFEVDYTLVGIGRAYGPPMNFQGTFPALYRNDGDGTFTEVSQEAGMQVRNPATDQPMAKSLGVAPGDLNDDGWVDLVVANDTVRNFVFINQKDGTFKETGTMSGIAFDSYGNARGAMGIDIGHFRNSSARGIAIGNFANEMTGLFVSSPSEAMLFSDEAITQGIGPVSRERLTFGIFFFDYDLDGWLDLLAVNGHLEEEIHKVQESQHYRQSAQLFWNASGTPRGRGFIPASEEKVGEDLFKPIVGRGSAYADIDHDGDLDVVMTQIGGPPVLLRNDQALEHNWIRLKLVGSSVNRDAIGAQVRVVTENRTYRRFVTPTHGYLSQSENVLTVGLGESTSIERVIIEWPGGKRQVESEVKLNTLNRFREDPESVAQDSGGQPAGQGQGG